MGGDSKQARWSVIIDADVHISPTPEGDNSITIDELLRRMDRARVDRAVTWLQPPYLRTVAASNEYVRQAMRSHPDRILGFGWIDPRLGVERARASVSELLDGHGFFGVKLNGAQNDYYIDDPDLSLPVIEVIARAGKPLALHVGADAYERTHPFRVGKVATRFPDLPILAVHMGGAAFADLSDAMIEIAQEHSNIVLVGSAVRARPILKAIKVLGARRVCFGSDTPFELMHVEVAKYRALLDGEVSDVEEREVMGGNIARLLGTGL